MKTIKCADVGGEGCDFTASGETAEEVKGKLSEHAKVAHAEMMKNATPESMEEWNKKYQKLWDETPEDGADKA